MHVTGKNRGDWQKPVLFGAGDNSERVGRARRKGCVVDVSLGSSEGSAALKVVDGTCLRSGEMLDVEDGWMEEDGREEKLWQRSMLLSVAVSVGRWLGCPHVGM